MTVTPRIDAFDVGQKSPALKFAEDAAAASAAAANMSAAVAADAAAAATAATAALSTKMDIAGGAFGGPVTLAGDATEDMQPVTRRQVGGRHRPREVYSVDTLLAALEAGGDYRLVDSIELGDAATIAAKAFRLVAAENGVTISRTRAAGSSYTLPIFDVRDASGFVLDGVGLYVPLGARREYAVIARATSQDACGRVVIQNCRIRNAPVHFERWVRGGAVMRCELDGLGASGGLGGVSTGGQIATDGSGTINSDGEVRDIFVTDCYIHDVRSEAVDVNWNTVGARILRNTVRNSCLASESAGILNEAFDVGGATDANSPNCRDILIFGNDVETQEHGVTIKQWSRDVRVLGNVFRRVGSIANACGVLWKDASDCIVEGNHFTGFDYGANYTYAPARAHFRRNKLDDVKISGIVTSSAAGYAVTDCDVSGNDIVAASGATGHGVDLSNATRVNICRTRAVGFAATGKSGLCIASSCADTLAADVAATACYRGVTDKGVCTRLSGLAQDSAERGMYLSGPGASYGTLIARDNVASVAGHYQVLFEADADDITVDRISVYDTRATKLARGVVFNSEIGRAQIGPVAVRGYLTTAISGATNVTAPSGKTAGVIDAANQIVSAA